MNETNSKQAEWEQQTIKIMETTKSGDLVPVFITVEDLYQEFKERLIDEIKDRSTTGT